MRRKRFADLRSCFLHCSISIFVHKFHELCSVVIRRILYPLKGNIFPIRAHFETVRTSSFLNGQFQNIKGILLSAYRLFHFLIIFSLIHDFNKFQFFIHNPITGFCNLFRIFFFNCFHQLTCVARIHFINPKIPSLIL